MPLALLDCFQRLLLLAQEQPAGEPAVGGGQPTGSLLDFMWPLLAIGVLFYFMLIRPQKREQSRRQIMLDGVKKNDRVVTIGGIYGVVTNVHREADEVTVKVDEAANVKIRVTLSSIARVLGDEPTDGGAAK